MSDKPKQVACPTCGSMVTWSEESTYRPFCSQRCRLIDLGEWFEEERGIPGESQVPMDNDIADLAADVADIHR